MSETKSLNFDLFGHALQLQCTEQAIIDDLLRRESSWKPLLGAPQSERPDSIVEVVIHPPPSPLTEVQHFSNEHLFFHGSSTRLLTGYLYTHPWQIHVQSFLEDHVSTLDNMILPVFNNILLRLGLVNVHCAAVSKQGQGILLIGPSQSGKSTTSLLMARAGFDFLSDNDVYLRKTGGKVAALASNKDLFLLENTAEIFPELEFTADLPLRSRGGTRKRVLSMGTVMPGRCVQETQATTVVFPQVGESEHTVVEALEPFECLQTLMERVPARGLPAMIKDQKAIQNLFELLSNLAQTARAYRVRLGTDPENVVSALSALV